MSHCTFFVKSVSQANIITTNWMPQKTKSVALEIFLKKKHPQTPPLLSRRAPKCPDTILSTLHWLKMKFYNFSNICRKSFLAWKKKFSTSIEWIKRSQHLRPFLHKMCGVWECFFPKTFRGLHWGIQLVNIFLSYLHMKQIWWKSAVWIWVSL